MTDAFQVDLKIPFPSQRHAAIAYDVLRIDEEPKRSAVTKTLLLEGQHILVNFSAEQAKHIRVGVNSFFEALILCTETMDQFGPPAEQYDHH